MKTLLHVGLLGLCLAATVPAAAQDAVATDLPPALKERQERARAAAEAKARKEAERAAARKPPGAPAAAASAAAPATATAPARPGMAAVTPLAVPDGSSGEPVLATTKIEKCADCNSGAARRLAVLPPRVGPVAPESGLAPESLGQAAAARLQAALSSHKGLALLPPAAVAAAAPNADYTALLEPARARQVPGELVLQIAIDRVDLQQQASTAPSGEANAALQRAERLEAEAQQAQEIAIKRDEDAAEALERAERMRRQTEQTQAQMRQQQQSRGALNLGALSAMLSTYGEASSTQEAQRAAQDARNRRAEAERKFQQAHILKDQAARAMLTDLVETTRTNTAVAVSWKLVDTLTGEPVAADTLRLSDGGTDQRRVGSAYGNGLNPAAGQRARHSVQKLLDQAVAQAAERLANGAAPVPLRTRITRVDRAAVLIAGGRNLGLEVGDSFAVRRIDLNAVDAASGRLANPAATQEGLLRVVEVGEDSARAVVHQGAGKLNRGDVLEWVGVYKPAAP